jgi:hypothetical protein
MQQLVSIGMDDGMAARPGQIDEALVEGLISP